MDEARVIIEVVAGLIPGGEPEREYSRKFVITAQQWHDAGIQDEGGGLGQAELLALTNGKAQGYAALLMMQPDRLNWVRTDWIWL